MNQGSFGAIVKSLWWLAKDAPPEIKSMSGGILADMNPKRLFGKKAAVEEKKAAPAHA